MHEDAEPSSPAMSHQNAMSPQSSPSFPSGHKNIGDITVDIDEVSNSGSSCSDDSDDEDGGVFFGKHSEAESRFLANISRSPPLPSPSPPSKHNRRQSRLVSRLRRDSTEFSRRKTLLAPPPMDDSSDDEEEGMQERYQKEISVLQISPSVLASARSSPPASPLHALCTGVDRLHFADCPSHDASSDSDSSSTVDYSECSADSSDANPDSDKENVQCPDSPVIAGETDGRRHLTGTSGSTIYPGQTITEYNLSIGSHGDFAEVLGLDMGGLRLDDFSEGAAGQMSASQDEEVTNYDSDDSSSVCHNPTTSLPPDLETGEAAESSSPWLGSMQLLSPPTTNLAPSDSPPSQAAAEVQSTLETKDLSSEASEGDSELDPLPISRAGPTINPFATFSPIRAIASPYLSPPRSNTGTLGVNMLSPPSRYELPVTPEVAASLESPTRPSTKTISETPLAARTPRQLGPLPTTATPSRAREDMVPPVDRGAKILKSQTAITSTFDQNDLTLIPLKDRNRALAVRGKLTAAFASRPGAMGPPQRTVSTSSSLSSSGSNGKQTAQTAPERSTSKKIERPSAVPTRPASSMARLPPVSTLGKGAQASTFRSGVQAKSLSSSLSARPSSALSTRPVTATSRPALAPRSLVTHPPKQPIPKPTAIKAARPITTVAPSKTIAQPQAVPVAASKNPLKRPLPVSSMAPPARQAITSSTGTRPALGLPSRLVWDAGQARSTPVFHIGTAPPQSHMAQIAMKSPARQATGQRAPGTPSNSKTATLGTPSRLNGTPRTVRAKPSFQMMSLAPKPPVQDVSEVTEATSSGLPSTSTRHASERQSSPIKPSDVPQRGSSADHEDVSMQLAQAPSSQSSSASPPSQTESPTKRTSPRTKKNDARRTPAEDQPQGSPSGSRPMRAAALPSNRARPRFNTPAAPWMTGKELQTTTERNTMRNQVYLCAIDRQIIHIPGPRPPSPTSKIRTTADRDEEAKKKSREHRAKRRGTSGQDVSPERPVIEKVERARGPGDDEDWKTPARPAKKAKLGVHKSVKWDRELVIIRDDGRGVCPPASETADEPTHSCVRTKIDLDKHGNLVPTTRPKEDLKRSKVVVTAVFYDGEEPVPEPETESAPVEENTRSSKGGGKRKK